LGEGDIPVEEGLRSLDTIGYDGCISVEWEKKWHPEIAEPEIAFPQYMRVLRTYVQ
jgi:sugar phosphate isomerase/epimerase